MRRARTFCAGSFFLVTGLGCLIVGLFVRAAYQPYSGGIQTTAKVTGLTRENGDSDSSFRPELTFITNEGETIVFNDSCSSSDAPGVGEEVRISYRPSDPTDARNLDSKCKLLSWILLLVGAVLLSGAILVIARSSWLCYKRSTQRQRTGRSDYHSNTRADVDNPAVIQLPMNLDPAFGSPEGPKVRATSIRPRCAATLQLRQNSVEQLEIHHCMIISSCSRQNSSFAESGPLAGARV